MLLSTAVPSERAGPLRKKVKPPAASAATTTSPIATAAQRTWASMSLQPLGSFARQAADYQLSSE